jgi:hypothetical protein
MRKRPIYVVTPKPEDELFPGIIEHTSMVTAIRDILDIGKSGTIVKDQRKWTLEYKEKWYV